jgi:hypothetical protein
MLVSFAFRAMRQNCMLLRAHAKQSATKQRNKAAQQSSGNKATQRGHNLPP